MDTIRITINIAGRSYPLNVASSEEETLRRVGKQIEAMVKDFEANFSVRDKQDALAMCALRMGTEAEVSRLNNDRNVQASNEKVLQLIRLAEIAER